VRYRKFCVIAAAFVFICLALSGCVTTGSVPAEITTQAAAVDTSISQLQTQQADTAVTAEQITSTTAQLEQTAKAISSPELTSRVTTLREQVTSLTAGLKTERKTTAGLQKNYTQLKVTSGTEIANQAAALNKLTARLGTSRRWNWILGIVLAVLVIGAGVAAFIKLKLKWF
jgi:hypothetical protein